MTTTTEDAYRQLREAPWQERGELVRQLRLTPDQIAQIARTAQTDRSLRIGERTNFFPWSTAHTDEDYPIDLGQGVREGLGQAAEPTAGTGGLSPIIEGLQGQRTPLVEQLMRPAAPNETQLEADARRLGGATLNLPYLPLQLYSQYVGQPFAGAVSGAADYLVDYATQPSGEFTADRVEEPPQADPERLSNQWLEYLRAQGMLPRELEDIPIGDVQVPSPPPPAPVPTQLDYQQMLQQLAEIGAPVAPAVTPIPAPPQAPMPVAPDLSAMEQYLEAAAPTAPDEEARRAAMQDQILMGLFAGILQNWQPGTDPLAMLMGGGLGGIQARMQALEGHRQEDRLFEQDSRAYNLLLAENSGRMAEIEANFQNARAETQWQNELAHYDWGTRERLRQDEAANAFNQTQRDFQLRMAELGLDFARLDAEQQDRVAQINWQNQIDLLQHQTKLLEASQPSFQILGNGLVAITRLEQQEDGTSRQVLSFSDPGVARMVSGARRNTEGLGASSRTASAFGAEFALNMNDPLALPYTLISELDQRGMLSHVFGDVLASSEFEEAGEVAMRAAVGAGQEAMEEATARGRVGFLAAFMLRNPRSMEAALQALGYSGEANE